MELLTVGVIGFQLAILLSMLLAASKGKWVLWLATLGWSAFTLFGSIHTYGLMLIQLVTIYLSFRAARRLVLPCHRQPQQLQIEVPTSKPESRFTENFFGLIVFCGVVIYLISDKNPERTNLTPVAAVAHPISPSTTASTTRAPTLVPQWDSRNPMFYKCWKGHEMTMAKISDDAPLEKYLAAREQADEVMRRCLR